MDELIEGTEAVFPCGVIKCFDKKFNHPNYKQVIFQSGENISQSGVIISIDLH
jgi:hypothetical protein